MAGANRRSGEVTPVSVPARRQSSPAAGPPGSPALTEDRTLNAAPQHRADDLAAPEEFTHSPADGRSYCYWLDQAHFTAAFNARSVGENLDMGDIPEIIIWAWKTSTVGHCEAQFTGRAFDSQSHQSPPGFTRVGMGEAVNRVSGKHSWTVIFAN